MTDSSDLDLDLGPKPIREFRPVKDKRPDVAYRDQANSGEYPDGGYDENIAVPEEYDRECGYLTNEPPALPTCKHRDAAHDFLVRSGLDPTPDAVDQLTEVFLPCLAIMCDRDGHPWGPNGETWRESGRKGVLTDVRKKFGRFWYRYWTRGKAHPDSGLDLINFVGFVLRSEDNGWNEWGEPG